MKTNREIAERIADEFFTFPWDEKRVSVLAQIRFNPVGNHGLDVIHNTLDLGLVVASITRILDAERPEGKGKQ